MRKELCNLFVVWALVLSGPKAVWADYTGSDVEGIESIVADIIEPSEIWRIEANQRIEEVRKADMEILVVDEQSGLGLAHVELDVQLIRHRFRFGGQVDPIRLNGDDAGVDSQLYKDTYLNLGFNAGGILNAFKPKLTGLHGYLPDSLAWFDEHCIPVRGHTLFRGGYSNLSNTVRSAYDQYVAAPTEQTRQVLAETIETEIRDWVSRWDVISWAVVNEPRGKRDITDILGFEAMVDWFTIADQYKVDPNAVLYLNENRIISDSANGILTSKISTYMDTVNYLLESGAPLTGLGMQSRFGSMLSADVIYQRLQLFDGYGLPIEATEFEMKSSIETELDKAQMTERAMTVYFSHHLVTGMYCWNVFPNRNQPHLERQLVDLNGQPNLRGKIWLYLIKQHWMTHESLSADETGRTFVRGFKGDYVVTVRREGMLVDSVELSLDEDASFVIYLSAKDS